MASQDRQVPRRRRREQELPRPLPHRRFLLKLLDQLPRPGLPRRKLREFFRVGKCPLPLATLHVQDGQGIIDLRIGRTDLMGPEQLGLSLYAPPPVVPKDNHSLGPDSGSLR